jgi:hypothetical protein
MLAFDGCDVMAILFYFETNESAIKMITVLLLVDCCMSLVAQQNSNAMIVF